MGYTHYWRPVGTGTFSADKWNRICDFARKVVLDYDARVCFEEDMEYIPPHVSDEAIRFNGQGTEAHETFWLSPKLEAFQFCKTARKPYDREVTAILAYAAMEAPDVIQVTSDGDESEWQDGLALAAKIAGKPVPYPVKEDAAAD